MTHHPVATTTHLPLHHPLQIEALSNELRATKRAMGEKETAAGEQVQALTAANAALSRELADARVKQVSQCSRANTSIMMLCCRTRRRRTRTAASTSCLCAVFFARLWLCVLQGPLLAETEALRAQAARLAEDVEEAKRSRADANARIERMTGGLAAAEAAAREMRGNEVRLVRAVEDEASKVAALQAAAARDAEIMQVRTCQWRRR